MQFILSANLVLNGPSCTLNAPLILLLLATMLITGFLVYETQFMKQFPIFSQL